MATINGINAAKANEILGESVVSGIVNSAGRLIFTRHNGETFDGGDFSTRMTEILDSVITSRLTALLPAAVAGTVVNKGNVTTTLTLPELSRDNLPNAMVTMTLAASVTFNKTSLPSNARPNSQFAMRIKQDSVGGRVLTLPGFKQNMGSVNLPTTANSVSMLAFIYDGTDWFVGNMGALFA